MNTQNRYLAAFAYVAVGAMMAACGAATPSQPALTPEQQVQAEAIRINKSDPPADCVEKGSVSAGSTMGDRSEINQKLRSKALRLGANYVRMDVGNAGYINGTAFFCPTKSLKE